MKWANWKKGCLGCRSVCVLCEAEGRKCDNSGIEIWDRDREIQRQYGKEKHKQKTEGACRECLGCNVRHDRS